MVTAKSQSSSHALPRAKNPFLRTSFFFFKFAQSLAVTFFYPEPMSGMPQLDKESKAEIISAMHAKLEYLAGLSDSDEEDKVVTELEREITQRDGHAKMNYDSLQTMKCTIAPKYALPEPLTAKHAVICIKNWGITGDKRIILLAVWCCSTVKDTTLPKVYEAPKKIVMRKTAQSDHSKYYLTPTLLGLWTVLLQGGDLEREKPKQSSQLISMQALREGYRVMITDTNDAFYGQTNAGMCMIPSTEYTTKQIRRELKLPQAQITVRRFSSWDDVKQFCCT